MPALAAYIGLQISPNGDGSGVGWLFNQLTSRGFFKNVDRSGGRIGLQLTIDGWDRYERLRRTVVQSRTAFMAMKFGDAELNRVVSECFGPAVARTGFTLRRLTDEQPAGLIDNQLRAAILGARFLISDLTHGNQGAYWETLRCSFSVSATKLSGRETGECLRGGVHSVTGCRLPGDMAALTATPRRRHPPAISRLGYVARTAMSTNPRRARSITPSDPEDFYTEHLR